MIKQISKNTLPIVLWICLLILGLAQGAVTISGDGSDLTDTVGSPGEIGPGGGEPIPYLPGSGGGSGGARIDGDPWTDDPEERAFYLDNSDQAAECNKIVYVLKVKVNYHLEPED